MRRRHYRRSKRIRNGIFLITLLFLFTAGLFFLDKSLTESRNQLQQSKDEFQQETEQAKKQVEELYTKAQAYVNQNMPGIVCWGDSLTSGMGAQKTNYPKELAFIIGDRFSNALNMQGKISQNYRYLATNSDYDIKVNVENLGAAGDTSDTILGRAEAVPFVLASKANIPETRTRIPITIESETGEPVSPLRFSAVGMETVTIAGVEGKLTISQESSNSMNYTYYFTREVIGNAVIAPKGTIVETAASKKYKEHIPVILIGATGGWNTSYELVNENLAMVEDYDKYIVLGLPTGTTESRYTMEALMEETFGDNYINLRKYLCENGLEDAGITPTREDLNNIEEGIVPASLRVTVDNDHLNDAGYRVVAKLVYNKMEELGYFDSIVEYLEALK